MCCSHWPSSSRARAKDSPGNNRTAANTEILTHPAWNGLVVAYTAANSSGSEQRNINCLAAAYTAANRAAHQPPAQTVSPRDQAAQAGAKFTIGNLVFRLYARCDRCKHRH
jgi:hypothetical protein